MVYNEKWYNHILICLWVKTLCPAGLQYIRMFYFEVWWVLQTQETTRWWSLLGLSCCHLSQGAPMRIQPKWRLLRQSSITLIQIILMLYHSTLKVSKCLFISELYLWKFFFFLNFNISFSDSWYKVGFNGYLEA